MEPQLVDYYNDFPSSAILIEKLNSEYEELQKKYDELEKKYNSIIIIPPKVRVSNVEEFYNYENELEELKEIIKEVFNSEIGTAGIYEKYTRLAFVCYLRKKIINCDNDNPVQSFLTSSTKRKNNLKI